MKNYTRDDIVRLVKEEDVEFIRLQFTDMFGQLKNIAITANQLDKALDNRCTFDGSSIDGFVGIEESDMYLHPDLSTLEIFPWRPQQGKVARMICDVYRPDGTPFEGDPRQVLKRAVGDNAGVVPALTGVIVHDNHVVGHGLAEHQSGGVRLLFQNSGTGDFNFHSTFLLYSSIPRSRPEGEALSVWKQDRVQSAPHYNSLLRSAQRFRRAEAKFFPGVPG